MVQVRHIPPTLTPEDARRTLQDLYGLQGQVDTLPSERDQNFRVTTPAGGVFVLKISHADEVRGVLEQQHRVLEHLRTRVAELEIPQVVPALSGDHLCTISRGTTEHLARVMTFVPGRVWAHVKPHSAHLLRSLGRGLALLDRALASAPRGDTHSDLKWDLTRASWIREHFGSLDPKRRPMVERLLQTYEAEALPWLASQPSRLLYNDANDYNVLVTGAVRVSSFIDFGDMVQGPRVCELAIGIAYAVMGSPEPVAAAAHVVAGYHDVLPLTEDELSVLYPLIRARLCVSVSNSAMQRTMAPGNDYLQISERPAWALLEQLEAIHPRFALYTFRAACGREPCPSSPSIVEWLSRSAVEHGPVVDVDFERDAVVFDASVGTLECGTLGECRSASALSRLMGERLMDVGARVGIGKYNEARLLYVGDKFVVPGLDGPEQRTVHLGIDLFTAPGTQVFAPCDGTVHSLADNAEALDYGPTIILEHAPTDGPVFYTLYGHLGRASLEGLSPGLPISQGQPIATIGTPDENGGWPPHLHFQIIADMLDRAGEFRGVAAPSRRAVWKSLCPDPNLILRIPASKFPAVESTSAEITTSRQQHLGANLSVAYVRPLHIVRGYLQHLYDADGRQYLDAVNNVPHVGHCHPAVVRAGQAQMAVLNTNTRYLHENITQYATRLCALLPEPLRVCFFVNSGSEAGELALRLARAHTGSHATVVLDGAYHGNTESMVAISPYKYDGPGGAGQADFIRKVPMPDTYRGPDAQYAEYVRAAAADLMAHGLNRPTFIAESLMGSSGQIELPDGFLREAYGHVRAARGVCIADEVQVGFGRVGSHFWGFETHDVVPDIVVLGKPMGNGHPMGAVITTPEIAASFTNGMEYFSTFGGNPVSCAIGLAVLDVIADESLQANALDTGAYFRLGLDSLGVRYPLIGDVRGRGLFLGVECVCDRESLEPAARQTTYVCNRLRDRGVLTSVDGPLHNVLKIKPPMVFTTTDADRFVEALDVVLGEDLAQP